MIKRQHGILLLMAGLLAACGGTNTGSGGTPGNPSGGSTGKDTLAPTVTILTPDSTNPLLPQPLTITGKLSDNVAATRASLVIDNGPAQEIAFRPGASADFSVTLTGLAAGQHTARVNAYDDSKNLGFADVKFQTSAAGTGTGGGTGGGGTGGGGTGGTDTTAPSLTITAPAPGATLGSSFTVLGNASDNASGLRVSASLDGGAAKTQVFSGTGGAFSLPFTNVSAGAHTLVITATDSSGLTTTRTISFTGSGAGSVDSSKPVLNLLTPTAGVSLTNPVLISGTATDNALAQVTYSVDGGTEQSIPVTAGLFNASVTLPAGTHTLTVNADDTSGNRSSQSVGVTVTGGAGGGGGGSGDTQGPVLTVTSPLGGSNVGLPLTLSGSASDPSGVASMTYSVNGGSAVNLPVTDGTFSASIGSLPTGNNTIVVTATDTNGNATSTTLSVTLGGAGGGSDTSAPSLSLNTPTDNQVVVGSVALSGVASDMGGVSSLTYRVDSGAEQPVTLNGGSFATTISGLTPGSHTVTVTAKDASDNVTTRSVTVQSVMPLVNGGGASYSVTKGTVGVLCLLCSVSGEGNVVNASLSDYANLTNAVGVAAGTYVQVTGPSVAAGRKVGFAVSDAGGTLLSAGALSGLTIRTYQGGTLQESYTAASLADLAVLNGGLTTVSGLQFTATKAFDSVRIENSATVGALSSLRVYFAYIQ